MKERSRAVADAVTRRRAMHFIAGAGAAIAYGCGGIAESTGKDGDPEGGVSTGDAGASADTATSADAGATEGGSDGRACTGTAEGEIGPYFVDDSAAGFNRSNILSNIDGTSVQSGVPLTLTITVLDARKNCAPYAGAQVDIWHCNAAGVYSDIASERTTTETWFRGYQLTDDNGRVTFVTILPGWYQGRTTHIHLRLRSSYSDASSTTAGTNTTQLFFDQTLVDALSTNVAPYSAEGVNPTTNATDRVYSEEVDGATLLALTGDMTSGYVGSITIALPITSNGFDAGVGGPGGPGGMGI